MADTSIDTFLVTQAKRYLAPATLRAFRSDLHNFRDWWEETRRRPFAVAHLTGRDLRQWLRHRQQVDGVSPRTINRNLSSLRRFFQWAVTEGLLPDDPALAITEIPSEQLSPRFLPAGAIDALLRAPHKIADERLRLRDEALLALLVYAGLRSGEARDLQLRDVDLAGESIVVRRGKGRKARRVPLHAEACGALAQYLERVRCPEGLPAVGAAAEREPLLLGVRMTEPGRPLACAIQTRVIRKRIRQLGQVAAEQLNTDADRTADQAQAQQLRRWAHKLEQVSPHQLRHSLARRLLKSGAQLPEVQRILGHSRLSTTGIYLLPSEADLHQAIERTDV
jgi:site-specific recombinase XerD